MPDPTAFESALNTPDKRERMRKEWLHSLSESVSAASRGFISQDDLAKQTEEFLKLLGAAVASGSTDVESPAFGAVRDFLERVSRSRAEQGFTSAETATFIFSLKQPLFAQLRAYNGADADGLARDAWTSTLVLDALGLYTVKTFQLNGAAAGHCADGIRPQRGRSGRSRSGVPAAPEQAGQCRPADRRASGARTSPGDSVMTVPPEVSPE